MDFFRFLMLWRSWIRPVVLMVYVLMLVVALPLMIFELNNKDREVQFWFVGGLFVILAIPISLWGILLHHIHYTQPHLQRYIVRILWMVPIYAVDSWFALKFSSIKIYMNSLRECYEAYVIYNFMAYLMTYLRLEYPNLSVCVSNKPQVNHLFPICCLPEWTMGSQFIDLCRHGVLQYTVIRPITTVITVITYYASVYGDGEFNFRRSWIYLVILNNISQIWAMYCLVMFYRATREELAPIKPVAKFMCVKAVVFLSFWQSLFISFLTFIKVIKPDNGNPVDFADSIQNLCICIEMFAAAIAHYYSFSHQPFVDYASEQSDCWGSFAHMWDVSDVRNDVVDHVCQVSNTVTRPLRSAKTTSSLDAEQLRNERTPLILASTSNCTLLDVGVEILDSESNPAVLGEIVDMDSPSAPLL